MENSLPFHGLWQPDHTAFREDFYAGIIRLKDLGQQQEARDLAHSFSMAYCDYNIPRESRSLARMPPMSHRYCVELVKILSECPIASLANIQPDRDGGRDWLPLNQKSFWLGRIYEEDFTNEAEVGLDALIYMAFRGDASALKIGLEEYRPSCTPGLWHERVHVQADSVLTMAVASNSWDCLAALAEVGISWSDALLDALLLNRPDIAERVAREGLAPADHFTGDLAEIWEDSWTPIRMAVFKGGSENVIVTLMSYGAMPDLEIIRYALVRKDPVVGDETLSLLVDAAVSLEDIDGYGMEGWVDFLCDAEKRGRKRTVKAVIDKSIPGFPGDVVGKAMLEWVTMEPIDSHHEEVTGVLLRYGFEVPPGGWTGPSVIDLICERDDRDIALDLYLYNTFTARKGPGVKSGAVLGEEEERTS